MGGKMNKIILIFSLFICCHAQLINSGINKFNKPESNPSTLNSVKLTALKAINYIVTPQTISALTVGLAYFFILKSALKPRHCGCADRIPGHTYHENNPKIDFLDLLRETETNAR